MAERIRVEHGGEWKLEKVSEGRNQKLEVWVYISGADIENTHQRF